MARKTKTKRVEHLEDLAIQIFAAAYVIMGDRDTKLSDSSRDLLRSIIRKTKCVRNDVRARKEKEKNDRNTVSGAV